MAGKQEANPFLGRRIFLLRSELGLTQSELADKLGFGSRQSLQQLEADERKLSVEEMLQLMELSGKSFEYFTDPFLWDGDGQFSFRSSDADAEQLNTFEQKAGGWIMLWRWLRVVNECPVRMLPGFDLGIRSSYEEVQAAAEQLVQWLQLGKTPAATLGAVLERELGIPVLYADIPQGISGATCHSLRGNVIFVNRHDVQGRRNFDLAHELFHVLTWKEMPPERLDRDDPEDKSAQRRETLANIFASTLLMPETEVRAMWSMHFGRGRDIPIELDFLHTGADYFLVSEEAFVWRLVSLEYISKENALQLIGRIQAAGSAVEQSAAVPALFSRFFLEQLAVALVAGKLSVRRAAKQLTLSVDELEEAYHTHDLTVPFDM
ncbi:MAG: hypothetical protein C0600_16115 [Ignavibacteria bacterium]|nr:MAG: hypothetical protein C0600_16115 [Ignavibacteria bacterium]